MTLYSTSRLSVCALISLKSSKTLQAVHIPKNQLHIVLWQQHLPTTRNVILQPVKDGSLQFSSASPAKKKTAGEKKSQALQNPKDKSSQSWEVARMSVWVRVSVASIRVTGFRIPGGLSASGRFPGAKLPNISLNTSDASSLKFIMEA